MKMKQCPKCGTEYDPRVQFCFRDGTPLEILDEALKKSEKIAGLENSASQVDDLDLNEISQDISIDDLLDIKGVSLGLDIGGIDLGGANFGGSDFSGADFGDFDLGVKENTGTPEKSVGSEKNDEKNEKKKAANLSIDEELGIDFDFENESDSDDLGEEITGELDFDEFENTLDLDAEMLAQEMEQESAGMVASPLVGMEGLQIPSGIGRMQNDDELLPGDTLDLELDLETVEGLEQLKAEEELKKQRAATAGETGSEETPEKEEGGSSSKFFLVAVLIGIVVTVAAMSFFGKDNNATEKEKQVEVEKPKEKKPIDIKPKIEEQVKEPIEKEVPPANEKKEEKPEVKVNKEAPGGMKLPTEKVPDKQNVIPTPKISTPKTNPQPKKTTVAPKQVTPKKVTPKKVEPKVDHTVTKGEDGSVGLWGAAPVTRCYVIFNSNVSDAKVFVNGAGWGKKVGQEIKVECNKKYRVKLQADGYIASEERVVQSDGKKEFFFELKQ